MRTFFLLLLYLVLSCKQFLSPRGLQISEKEREREGEGGWEEGKERKLCKGCIKIEKNVFSILINKLLIKI